MNQIETGRRDFLRTTFVAGGCVLAGGASVAWAKPAQPPAGLPHVDPKELRIDPRRLQVAYDLMESWTTGRNAPVPGGAILVGRGARCLAPRFFGRQGPEADAEPSRRDDFLAAGEAALAKGKNGVDARDQEVHTLNAELEERTLTTS